MTKLHERNPLKHEYEIQMDGGPIVFAGNREDTAVHKANEALADHLEADYVRLYHTYPSPGPMRRYVGIIKRDGKLHRMV